MSLLASSAQLGTSIGLAVTTVVLQHDSAQPGMGRESQLNAYKAVDNILLWGISHAARCCVSTRCGHSWRQGESCSCIAGGGRTGYHQKTHGERY
jgi:hypothetical protein